jgi:hypothetical protein
MLANDDGEALCDMLDRRIAEMTYKMKPCEQRSELRD